MSEVIRLNNLSLLTWELIFFSQVWEVLFYIVSRNNSYRIFNGNLITVCIEEETEKLNTFPLSSVSTFLLKMPCSRDSQVCTVGKR